MEEKILGNKISNIYNWMISSEEAKKADPNAFELVELFTEMNDLRLKGMNISEEAKVKLNYIWNNRKENTITNGFSYDNLFYKILESCFDGELANISLTGDAKFCLKKIASIDLYISQRRREQPNYMHDNENEMLEVSGLIAKTTKEIGNKEYHDLTSQFENVLFQEPKGYSL